MRIFLDNDSSTVNVVQSVASASTMISSLAAEAKEYVIQKFPKGYFKHIYIDTSETVTQQHRNDKYNYNANKIPYPSMTITPEISLDDPIGGMEKSMHLSSPNLYLRKDINRTYNKIIIDPDDKYGIYYTSDYITTNFNFKITTNSFIQNADLAFYLKSRFQKDFFQYLNGQHIQTEIPKSFIKMIADFKGYDMNNPEEMDELRLYLIGSSKSEQAILKRVNMATGKDCFFINERVNLLTLFTDLDCPPSINRDGQTEGEYVISFRFQVSCHLPNAFILRINRSSIKKLDKETILALESDKEQQEQGLFAVHSFINNNVLSKKNTINFYDKSEEKQIGHLIYNDIFTYTLNTPFKNVELMNKMKDEFKKVHAYALNKLHVDLTSLIYPLVVSRDGVVPLDDFSFEYESLVFSFSSTLDSDISISLYVNRLLYESIKIAMQNDSDYFNSNYLTSIIANIADENVRVMVKSFTNDRAMYSASNESALRVKTPYGIGYISLLDDSNTMDAYKICIGYDSDDNPIIKQFELEK